MNDILSVENLRKNFGAFCLSGITFNLPKGFIMGMIGHNGAGKTTTIKLLLNMLKKDGGTIRVFGKDGVTDEREIKQRIGVVLDETFYCAEWRLTEVEKVLARFYEKWSADTFYERLARFGLDRGKRVRELSRGMKMKLMIAAALSHGAELLVLDEPTSGLDAAARAELLEILAEFIEDGERSVLFSTHITADLEKTADYITFLADGKLMYTGVKEGLTEKYVLIKGGLGALDNEMIAKTVGYREHSVGFDAIVEAKDLAKFPQSIHAERADLDEILVRFHSGGVGQ